MRICFRCLFYLIVIPVILVVGAHTIGLPGFLKRELFLLIEKEGVYLEADTVLVQLHRGIVLRELSVYAPQDRVSPLLQAEQALLHLDIPDLLGTREVRGALILDNGNIHTDVGLWVNDLQTSQKAGVTGIQCEIGLAGGMLDVRSFSGMVEDIQLDLTGTCRVAGNETTRSRDAALSGDREDQTAGNIARVLAKVLEQLERYELDHPAHCDIRFQVDPTLTPKTKVDVKLHFQGLAKTRGVPLERIELDVGFTDDRIDVRNLRLAHGADALEVKGSLTNPDNVLELEITNTLPRYYLDHLAPPVVFRVLERLDIRLEGDTHFSLHLGPDPFEQVGRTIAARFDLQNGFYKDTPFPRLKLDLDYRNRRLMLRDLQGEAGMGVQRGPISGDILYDFNNGGMAIDLQGGFNPLIAGRLISGTSETVIRQFEFPTVPPKLNLSIRQNEEGAEVTVDADIQTEHVIYRGTQLDKGNAHILLTNGVLTVSGLKARRGNEELQGRVEVSRRGNQYTLDLESTIHPHALARVLSANLERKLAAFRFKGTNRVAVAGVYDAENPNHHNLQGTFSGSGVGWKGVALNQCASSFKLAGNSLVLPDLSGSAKGGTLAGTLILSDLDQPAIARFSTQLLGVELDLFELVNAGMDTTNNPYSGLLSFKLQLDGLLNEAADSEIPKESYQGKGNLVIKEGKLFKMPLLFGLSRILSKVVKGFGYASQTEFSADFDVARGRVQSDNLFLEGKVLSVKGRGYYSFSNRLKMTMQVKLLSKGLLSEALQLITWPITKLVEIQVSGSLDEPNWQPKNLPKELFGK